MAANIISRIRRNHGLEHASIHMLSARYKNFNAQGHSNHRGFSLNIYGELPETAVHEAVHEAFSRMKKGEHHLAVHPNCGTVLLTTAAMATVAAQASFALEQRRQKQKTMNFSVLFHGFPSAIMAVVIALIVSRPVGVQLQAQYTVEGDLGDLEIVSIKKVQPSFITRIFQLLLTGGSQVKTHSYRIVTRN